MFRVDYETQQICTGGPRSVWVDGPPKTQAWCNELNEKWVFECGHLPEAQARALLPRYYNQEHKCLNISKDKGKPLGKILLTDSLHGIPLGVFIDLLK